MLISCNMFWADDIILGGEIEHIAPYSILVTDGLDGCVISLKLQMN